MSKMLKVASGAKMWLDVGMNDADVVKSGKRWETSWTRRLMICFLTFVIVVLYNFLIIRTENIVLASVVPVVGFLLSVASLYGVKKVWEG